jgi:CRISPR-associated endonuclease/helicase Cas3
MHSLDVAAVGYELAVFRPRAIAYVGERLGWSAQAFRDLWVFLLALHDIGKFSEHFQAKAEPFWPADVFGPLARFRFFGSDPGHPAAGDTFLFEPRARRVERMEPRRRSWFPGWDGEHEMVRTLFAPILGHHGRPVSGSWCMVQDLFRDSAEGAALAFADAMHGLLQPPILPEPKAPVFRRVSWAIAGLTTIADWVGSNRDWFPYQGNGPTVESYWEVARSRARRALTEAGLAPPQSAFVMGFSVLTGFKDEPSPVQAWAGTVPLPDGPLLLLIEDMTGGGKTEAAIMAAHRLMAAGRAGGIYFALPTMATANAMFARVEKITERLYRPGIRATLALAHGHARLHPRFRKVCLARSAPKARNAEELLEDDDEDSALTAPEWLTSETRKALLADLGVGTIDQAILGVLPAKYQSLRLVGLAEKVLIVDEAHAYDAYMSRELEQLIAFQAALGGSTIVLSATLPQIVKQRFAAAWSKALRLAAPSISSDAYPCVTLLAPRQERPLEEPQAPRGDLPRVLRVERLPDPNAAIVRIADAARTGAAVAWVRNSVDDVLSGAALLSGNGIEAQIFHARFAMGDRLAIETDVVRRFGKYGKEAERHGRVLVASQAIEQSLDVDFDLIVSDLAPIDLLLQRAGRLWRHSWRAHRPIAGPMLLVVSPDPREVRDANWYRDAFPLAASVYDHPVVLWRTALELFTRGAVHVPENVRALIEAVYGPGLEERAPEVFERSANRADGRASAERSFAEQNLLKVESGYVLDRTPWLNEVEVATRLSEETRKVRLAVEEAGALRPWCRDADRQIAWSLSEITVRERKLRGHYSPLSHYREAAEAARAIWGKFEEDVILLPLAPASEGHWTGVLVDDTGREQQLRYSSHQGLQFG